MKKTILILIALILIPFSAQAGLLEFFFPTLKKDEPNPAETLVAPFAVNTDAEIGKINTLPTNAIPLDKPHRLSSDINKWIAVKTIEALNFLEPDYAAQLEKNRASFDTFGYGQYQSFLTQNGITRTLQSGQYTVRTFNDKTPLLMNEGAVDGRYRWLYRVPIMVTYLQAGADGYNNAKPQNAHGTIDIQIGRNNEATDNEGILIERWSGKITAAQ